MVSSGPSRVWRASSSSFPNWNLKVVLWLVESSAVLLWQGVVLPLFDEEYKLNATASLCGHCFTLRPLMLGYKYITAWLAKLCVVHRFSGPPLGIRSVIYFVLLIWCFLGVSIVADIFMNSIETITSRQCAA
eukprot:4174630-Amphidinium_carterae.2